MSYPTVPSIPQVCISYPPYNENFPQTPIIDIPCLMGQWGLHNLSPQISAIQSSVTQGISNLSTSQAMQAQSIRDLINNNQASVVNLLNYAQNQIIGRIQSESAIQLYNQQQTQNQIQQAIGATSTQVNFHTNNAINQQSTWINSRFNELQNSVGGIVGSVVGGIEDVIGGITDPIEAVISDILNTIGDFVSSIRDFLEDIWERWIEAVQVLGDRFVDFVRNTLSFSRDEITGRIGTLQNIYDRISNGSYSSYDEMYNDIEAINMDSWLLDLLLGAMQVLPTFYHISSTQTQPFREGLQQLSNQRSGHELLSPPELIALFNRKVIDREFFDTELGYHGYNAERILKVLNLGKQLTPENVLMVMLLKGTITDEAHDYELSKYGFDSEQIRLIKESYFYIPPVADLITMAVREVFTPETSERYGLYQDFPEDFAREARKAGLSDEWARKYWAMHWQLPSPQMGFSMFHRGIIEYADLELLLKSLDIMPFWRDLLINLSYNPLTRVDIRRMYGLGVLNEEEIYRAYLDTGYSPENARRLTNFTILYENRQNTGNINEQRQLTQGLIVRAFKEGVITRDNAIQKLIQIGYEGQDANLILTLTEFELSLDNVPDRTKPLKDQLIRTILKSYKDRTISRSDAQSMLLRVGYSELDSNDALNLEDLQHNEELKSDIITVTKELFLGGEIDPNGVLTILSQYNFTVSEIENLAIFWQILKDLRYKKLTPVQYMKAYNTQVIDYDELLLHMRGLGYTDRSIDILLLSNGISESRD